MQNCSLFSFKYFNFTLPLKNKHEKSGKRYQGLVDRKGSSCRAASSSYSFTAFPGSYIIFYFFFLITGKYLRSNQ